MLTRKGFLSLFLTVPLEQNHSGFGRKPSPLLLFDDFVNTPARNAHIGAKCTFYRHGTRADKPIHSVVQQASAAADGFRACCGQA